MALEETTPAKKKKKNENKNMMIKGNNLFMCFRPVVLEPDGGSGSGINDPVLTYIAVQRNNRESVVFPKKALLENDSEKALSFEGMKEKDFQAGKKISGSRRFSHALKAVLFEASMAKKIKKGKSNKKSSHSLSESGRHSHQKSSHKHQFDFDFGRRLLISRGASASATSSSASTAASSSRPSSSVAKPASFVSNSTESKPPHENTVKQRHRQRGYDMTCNGGLFLMLLGLLVLLFWGKICAIVYTSTWFCFVPRSAGVEDRGRVDLTDPPENSSECKRKIVMEGLLARERRSFRCQ